MKEPTGYSEKRYEEHPPGLENLPEIEERLWERAGDGAAAIWPGGEREEARLEGRPSFQDEAREWWRSEGAGLDVIEADLAIRRHGDILEGRLMDAGRRGAAFGETMLEMLREYRELDYRIEPREAEALALEAAQHAISAQEAAGGRGPQDARERADALARHLQRNGGRNIDPEYVGGIFRDMETVLQYAENAASLEQETDADEDSVLDRATLELLGWAVKYGECGRWADGKRLGWSPDETERRMMEAWYAQGREVDALGYDRAPDPGEGLPGETLMEWARVEGYLDGWIRDYQEVLDALDGDENVPRPPGWALTARGQLRRQGAERMREAVEQRLEIFRQVKEGTECQSLE